MLDHLVGVAIKHRVAVLLLTALLAVSGWWAFRGLTIEAFPDPTDTQVTLIAQNPGQPAEEMERQVAIPIERAVNGTPGLTRVRSINLFGLSFVTLTFRDGVDALFARAQTLERLAGVKLPNGVQAELGSLSTPIGEIYRYTLRSERADPLLLRTLQDWTVAPRLLKIEGVADVVSYGGLVREIQVRPDPTAMAARGLTMLDLERALSSASANASGGVVERGAEQLVIRSEGLFKDLADLRSISLATRDGTAVPLAAVASVQDGWTPRQGVVSRGQELDAVEGIVLMRRGQNPSQVLAAVRAEIDTINQRVLPQGTSIWAFYDRTELLGMTLDTVGRNLAEGAILVTVVLFVFLLDLRAALIVASLIPLSLCAAFTYLRLRGMPANLISLGAVDFGIIVDGAVVIIETIVLRVGHDSPTRAGPAPTMSARILAATREVARPTVFALLIIIAAYLPIFLLERVEGRIFGPMAHTVVAALIGSLLLSLTLVPVLATFAYRKPQTHRESPVLAFAARCYEPLLRTALRWPLTVLLAAALSLAGSARLLADRGSEFLPELNEGALYLTFTLPSNISLSEGRKLVPTLTTIIDGFPEVEAHLSQLGRPEDGTDAKLTSNLEYFVKLKPATEWPAEVDSLGKLIEKMAAGLSIVPGLEINFSQPIRDNVNENISGQSGQVALKIYASDLKQLQSTAEAAKQALSRVPGVADLGIVKSGELPQVRIEPDRAALGRFGLSMAELQSFIEMALGGRIVGSFWDEERSFDIALRLPGSTRETVEEVSALRVPTPSGALVALSSLAKIEVGFGRATINRENGQRYIGIRMNVRGRDLGSFVNDARAAVDRALPAQRGTTLEWGGEFESKERAMNRLLLVIPVALVVTLALLFNVFGSFPLALLVLASVPLALVGGAVGLWWFDMPLSIAAAVGFIALVGQASLNGVLVISAIEQRRLAGQPLTTAILTGARDRLRPVLMTAALAALGLLPAAFSRAMGAETQRPIAVVIVGGTISAAALTLVVLPVAYRLLMSFLLRYWPAVVASTPPAPAATVELPASAA